MAAPSAGARVATVPTSPKGSGDLKATGDAKRGNAAASIPTRVPSAAPLGTTGAKKKSADDMFGQID
jgi:hypothetical protein